MAVELTFEWVSNFVDKKYPGEVRRPDSAVMAIAKVLLSAAVLNTSSPTALASFTRYDIGFILAVLWNLNNNKRCNDGRYDPGHWLWPHGEFLEECFWEEVFIAGGDFCDTLAKPSESIDAEVVYWNVVG